MGKHAIRPDTAHHTQRIYFRENFRAVRTGLKRLQTTGLKRQCERAFSNKQQYVVMGGVSSESTRVIWGSTVQRLGTFVVPYLHNHISSLNIIDGSKITMYAEDILLFKPIKPRSHGHLYPDRIRIDAVHMQSSCRAIRI